MAIAELQVRQAALSVLVQLFASNQRLPSSTVKIPTAPMLDNMPLDSIACIGCSFADAGDTSIFCDLTLEFRYYSGLAAVKGAGSLKQPPVLTANVSLRLELLVSVSGGKPLMMFKDPLGFVNLGSLASASFDLSDMAPFVVVAGAIVQATTSCLSGWHPMPRTSSVRRRPTGWWRPATGPSSCPAAPLPRWSAPPSGLRSVA